MSTDTTPQEQRARPVFGNFRRPTTAGIGRLGTGPVLVLVVLFLCTYFAASRFGSGAGTFMVVVMAAYVVGLVLPDKHGVTLMKKFTEWWAFRNYARTGLNTLHQGVAGHTGDPSTPPPGLLSTAELLEYDLGDESVMTMVAHPKTKQYAVPLLCHPNGGELHEDDAVDGMVAAFAEIGKTFASTPEVDAYTITVAITPEFADQGAAAIEDTIDPRAPAIAAQIVRETAAEAVANKYRTTTWFTPIFSPTAHLPRFRRRRDDEGAGDTISRHLPALVDRLADAGAGWVRCASAQEVIEDTAAAYDPELTERIQRAASHGDAVPLTWETAGPTTHVEQMKRYEHNGAISITWYQSVPQEGTFSSDVLTDILSAHPAFFSKRVTLYRKVIPSGIGAEIVELDYKHAKARAEGFMPSATAERDLEFTEQTRRERLSGARLEDFTMFVTVTVLEEAAVPGAIAAIENDLAPNSGVLLRIVRDGQAPAFQATLPLGVDLIKHNRLTAVAEKLR